MAIIQDRRSVEAKMGTWAEIEVWRQRRAELIREAQERALAREARKGRDAFAAAEARAAGGPPGGGGRGGRGGARGGGARRVGDACAAAEERPAGVPLGMEVRWGLAEDEPAVAELLELNGMPRWVAFEERFIVAEKNGKLVGAVRYATESKRLTLGLLVVDPWAGERRVSKALSAGPRALAQELGANVVVASEARANYPRAAGFRHHGRKWRAGGPRPDGGPSSGGRLGRAVRRGGL